MATGWRTRAGSALAAALSLSLLGALASRRDPPAAPIAAAAPPPAAASPPEPPAPPEPADPPAPPPPPTPAADAAFDRRARTAFSGGYLVVTPAFSAQEGVYDVVVHFHGNTELVEQSLGYAGINAVFVPQNLGVGSAPYDTRFQPPGAFAELLSRVQAAMVKRGLARARLGRVALMAWSAGFGAIARILARPEDAERVDAVLLVDSFHLGFAPGKRAPDLAQLAPWERFARRAAEGTKLLTITHSDIAPDAFLGAHDAADLLLRRLGVPRYAAGEFAVVPDLPAVEGTAPKRHRVPLSPLTLADRGRLTVRGYAGDQPEHHIQHLMQVGSIALPDLAAWWRRPHEGSP